MAEENNSITKKVIDQNNFYIGINYNLFEYYKIELKWYDATNKFDCKEEAEGFSYNLNLKSVDKLSAKSFIDLGYKVIPDFWLTGSLYLQSSTDESYRTRSAEEFKQKSSGKTKSRDLIISFGPRYDFYKSDKTAYYAFSHFLYKNQKETIKTVPAGNTGQESTSYGFQIGGGVDYFVHSDIALGIKGAVSYSKGKIKHENLPEEDTDIWQIDSALSFKASFYF